VEAPKLNLAPSPDFNGKAGEQPSGWTLRNYGGKKDDVVMALSDGGRNGGTCLKITAKGAVDAGAGADIEVKPRTRYRLSGWVRTENLQNRGGMGALLNIHGMEPKTQAISGTRDWTLLQVDFNSGNDDSILIHCLFGGYGGAVGTAWFDDVSLTESSGNAATDLITPLASHLASKGTPEQKQTVVNAFAKRSDSFAKSIIAAVGTAPTAEVAMVRKFKPDAAVHERGSAVYARTCIACHGPDGKGVPGAFPPLDGSDWPVGDATIPIRILLAGLQGPIEVKGQKFQNIMPPHIDLKDDEIADVLTYVRQSWSNDAAAVDSATVKKVRADHAGRKTPWTAEELRPH
jgi:mono/diheme cytochrome c family protein